MTNAINAVINNLRKIDAYTVLDTFDTSKLSVLTFFTSSPCENARGFNETEWLVSYLGEGAKIKSRKRTFILSDAELTAIDMDSYAYTFYSDETGFFYTLPSRAVKNFFPSETDKSKADSFFYIEEKTRYDRNLLKFFALSEKVRVKTKAKTGRVRFAVSPFANSRLYTCSLEDKLILALSDVKDILSVKFRVEPFSVKVRIHTKNIGGLSEFLNISISDYAYIPDTVTLEVRTLSDVPVIVDRVLLGRGNIDFKNSEVFIRKYEAIKDNPISFNGENIKFHTGKKVYSEANLNTAEKYDHILKNTYIHNRKGVHQEYLKREYFTLLLDMYDRFVFDSFFEIEDNGQIKFII